MLKRILLGVIPFLMVSLVGCDQIQAIFQPTLAPKITSASSTSAAESSSAVTSAVSGTVLAKINDEVITLEDFDQKIKDVQAADPEAKLSTIEEKKNFLNGLVNQELFYQEAKGRGIDKKKDVQDAIREFSRGIVIQQLIIDETKGIAVERSEVESFYNQYKREFASPQEAHVREIVVSSESTAKEILISLLQGGDFAAIAKERSISPSAAKGGDLGFLKPAESGKFDKFAEVISTLEPGAVSQIFKGPEGYYIVKVEERRGGDVPALVDVYQQIKDGLTIQKSEQRGQDLIDKLKRDAKVEIKEELLH